MGPAPVVQPPALPVRCLYLPLHMSLLRNVIAGARHPSTGSETFEIREPATGESSGHTPLSLAADVEAAAAAAARAFPEWRASPPVERARVLFRLKTLLDENKFDLMIWHRTLVREHGKILDDARGEIQRGIEKCGARLRNSHSHAWRHP